MSLLCGSVVVNFLCVRTGWYGFGLRPDDPLVVHRTGGMRGARGVKTRSSGLVPLVASGMYTFVVVLLQLCVRLCWPWLHDVVVHVHVFVVVHGHVSRAAVPIPV